MENTDLKIIQFDGIAIPNPGVRGIGVIFIDNGAVVDEISKKIEGLGTNNEAEYMAVIEGLQHAFNLGWKDFCIQGDSQLVINQLKGLWAVKADNLKRLNILAKEIIKKFDNIKLEWIKREMNSKADEMASKALGYIEDPYHDKVTIKPTDKTNDTDFLCPKCKRECKFEWQTFKNETRHIRQSCPVCGFVKYAPKVQSFIEIIKRKRSILIRISTILLN
jgi:ribonuclease HI